MNIGGGTGGRWRIRAPPATGGRKDREEDLALFQQMLRHEKERNISLLQPVSVEFDPNNGIYPLHRIRSGKKGLAYDLLPAEAQKNDYDWLKTPPATPLFPSLEMEANPPNLIIQREIPLLQLPKPSRFAGKREEPKPITRQRSPAPSSTSSSRTTNVTPTARSTQVVEPKKGAERGRRPSPSAITGRKDVKPAQQEREQAAVAAGEAQVGNMVLGSRMVEKVIKARSAGTAVMAAGGGLKPKERGGPKDSSGYHGRLSSQSSHDVVGMKTTVSSGKAVRKRLTNGDQKQNQVPPKNSAPRSSTSSSASTPRMTPRNESKEDRNLLRKGIRRGGFAMC